MKVLSNSEFRVPFTRRMNRSNALKSRLKELDAGQVNSIVLAMLVVLMFVSAVNQGLVSIVSPTKKQAIAVNATDLMILETAQLLLSDESNWDKNSDKGCLSQISLSLYCSLELATTMLLEENTPPEAVLQEVRVAIEDRVKTINAENLIANFNSSGSVDFEDITTVLAMATSSVSEKLSLPPQD